MARDPRIPGFFMSDTSMLPPMPDPFFLGGPTASGKSVLAVALAQRLGARIINADAFQIYAGLPVLTAQPAPDSFAQVRHELYGMLPVNHSLDAAQYWQMASQTLAKEQRPAIIVGGTGLYLRTLLRGGLDRLPASEPELRLELEQTPLPILTARLLQLDPVSYEQIDLRNPRRVVRTLEICLLSGQPASALRKWNKKASTELRGVWLQWDRESLHERIAIRSQAILENGGIDEVAASREQAATTARQAIGFRPIEALLDGDIDRETCQESIAKSTRQYAKRQETWFRKEPALLPLPCRNENCVESLTEKIVSQFGG